MPHASAQFHAVGQGGFYSAEIFCNPNNPPFRMVYDCGSETAGNALEREVALFHQIIDDEPLDMLVLSHLDADHVNGLSLLLDGSMTVKDVFLPYLTPMQRAIAAAGAGDEADPDYFEFLADPVGFLNERGAENVVFIGGGEDEQEPIGEQDLPTLGPEGDDSQSPSFLILKEDYHGKETYRKNEENSGYQKKGQPSRTAPSDSSQTETATGMSAPRKFPYFKAHREAFRLTPCWQGKFFHKDDMPPEAKAISSTLDFEVRVEDSASVRRYKRFFAEVYHRFGTLDTWRLVLAIRDESDRKKLRECYRHIRSNHNDASLALWHGPMQPPAFAQLMTGNEITGWEHADDSGCSNGGTLLTGDLTCRRRVVDKMVRHFGSKLGGSAFLQVPHHGSVHSWHPSLLDVTNPGIMSIICAGTHNGYGHPHPQVTYSLSNSPRCRRWFVSSEYNTVATHIQAI